MLGEEWNKQKSEEGDNVGGKGEEGAWDEDEE